MTGNLKQRTQQQQQSVERRHIINSEYDLLTTFHFSIY